MKDYTNLSPVFLDKVKILETTDANHADNFNAATKQLLDNDLCLKEAIDKNNTNGFKIYTSPVQLGIDINNIASLVEIINKMPDYSAFYYLTGDSVDGLYSKKLVPAEYGSLQITRYNINRVILGFTASGTGYHNFYNYTYTAFYHTSQDDVSEWIKTINEKNYRETIPGVNSILNLYDVNTRPVSMDVDLSQPAYQNRITYMLATGSVTEGMPPTNAVVLNLGWDNSKWGAQLAIGNGTGSLFGRGFNANTGAMSWEYGKNILVILIIKQ